MSMSRPLHISVDKCALSDYRLLSSSAILTIVEELSHYKLCKVNQKAMTAALRNDISFWHSIYYFHFLIWMTHRVGTIVVFCYAAIQRVQGPIKQVPKSLWHRYIFISKY